MNSHMGVGASIGPEYEEAQEVTEQQLQWFRQRLLAFDWDYALSNDPAAWEFGLRMQEQMFSEATGLGVEALTMYFQVLGYPSFPVGDYGLP